MEDGAEGDMFNVDQDNADSGDESMEDAHDVSGMDRDRAQDYEGGSNGRKDGSEDEDVVVGEDDGINKENDEDKDMKGERLWRPVAALLIKSLVSVIFVLS